MADNVGTKKGEVRCRNCGYEWYPDPRKWRNGSSPNGFKMLFCPYCAVKNRLDKAKMHEIIARAEVIAELRHIGRRA
jgi:hypothetical protein